MPNSESGLGEGEDPQVTASALQRLLGSVATTSFIPDSVQCLPVTLGTYLYTDLKTVILYQLEVVVLTKKKKKKVEKVITRQT